MEKNRVWDYLLILGTWFYVYIWNLGVGSLAGDERIYGNNAFNILTTDHIFPHMTFAEGLTRTPEIVALEPFVEKPPLVMWLQALSLHIFGKSEFAIRFPSALATIGVGALIYKFASDVFNRLTGFMSALFFLILPYMFNGHNAGRRGGTDMVFLFFGVLFLYGLWKFCESDQSKYLYISSASLSCTILAKGPAGLLFVGIAFPFILYKYKKFLRSELIDASSIGLLFLSPLFFLYHKFDQLLVKEMIVEQFIKRASSGLGRDFQVAIFDFMRYPYFQVLPEMFDPVIYFLIPAILFTWQKEKKYAIAFSWWIVSVFSLFTLTGSHPTYILPIAVPMAVLSGILFSDKDGIVYTVFGILAWILFSPRFGFIQYNAPLMNQYLPELSLSMSMVIVSSILALRYLERNRAVQLAKFIFTLSLVVGFLGNWSMMKDNWASSSEEEIISNGINAEINKYGTLHVTEEFTKGKYYWSLGYYINANIMPFHEDAEYVLSKNRLEGYKVEYRTKNYYFLEKKE